MEEYALYPIMFSEQQHYSFKAALEELIDSKHVRYREFKYDNDVPEKIKTQLSEEEYSQKINFFKDTIQISDVEVEWDLIDPMGLPAEMTVDGYKAQISDIYNLFSAETSGGNETFFAEEVGIHEKKLEHFTSEQKRLTQAPICAEIRSLILQYKK